MCAIGSKAPGKAQAGNLVPKFTTKNGFLDLHLVANLSSEVGGNAEGRNKCLDSLLNTFFQPHASH